VPDQASRRVTLWRCRSGSVAGFLSKRNGWDRRQRAKPKRGRAGRGAATSAYLPVSSRP
jgi:hypothetical protein